MDEAAVGAVGLGSVVQSCLRVSYGSRGSWCRHTATELCSARGRAVGTLVVFVGPGLQESRDGRATRGVMCEGNRWKRRYRIRLDGVVVSIGAVLITSQHTCIPAARTEGASNCISTVTKQPSSDNACGLYPRCPTCKHPPTLSRSHPHLIDHALTVRLHLVEVPTQFVQEHTHSWVLCHHSCCNVLKPCGG